MAAFFLPRAGDDEQAERLYGALAEFAGCEPAPPGWRVESIAFTEDGARWVAEVGQELSGQRTTQQLRRGELVERTEVLASTTRVLAVYPGTPFVVVTDAQPITGTPSEWANPFLVRPDEVTYFDAPEADGRRTARAADRGHDRAMTTPEPNVPVERSMPEPEDVAMEMEAPGDAEEMADQNDPRYGTVDQEDQP